MLIYPVKITDYFMPCSVIWQIAHSFIQSTTDQTAAERGCVLVVSRRGAPDSCDRIVLGKACIRSAYCKLGKSPCLLFLWYWKEIQPYYLLKFTPNCKWYRELIDWFIRRNLVKQSRTLQSLEQYFGFPLDILYGRVSDRSDKCFRKYILTAVQDKLEGCP